MNILIPIGGIGQRFKDEGFNLPKPLINVLGKPMVVNLLDRLNISSDDLVHIVYNPELKFYNFEDLLKKKFPNVVFNFVPLKGPTRGAAETVLCGLENLSDDILHKEFLLLDCDTFYDEDIISIYKNSPYKNSIFYFKDYDNQALFSYIDLDDHREVLDIMEKVKISDNANTGAYGFESGILLKKFCLQIMEMDSELYISFVYKRMIQNGIRVKGIPIENFNCVGTPLQLKVFCENSTPKDKIRICFDLDNTLVSFPKKNNDYTTVEPIQKNIEYLRYLKERGNYIIIYTARRMKTHNGNLGKIVPDVASITLETLEKFEIPYDEIHFGKPWADFYIDDLAVPAFSSLDKAIGFYNTKIQPRDFNKIEYLGNIVKKITNNPGEIYFYQNIPKDISDFFPQIFSLDERTISMEKVKGVTFSYLYVNGILSVSNLKDLILSLQKIHNSEKHNNQEFQIYSNYKNKTVERFIQNSDAYMGLENCVKIFQEITSFLENYEKNKKGKPSVIHGDPVFTNIFVTERGLKFIDPRGNLNGELSIYGDCFYDFAKVFQSLYGYDNILHDLEINYDYRERMVSEFSSFFSGKEFQEIKKLTASLLFSMFPLHRISQEKKLRYYNLIKDLLQ